MNKPCPTCNTITQTYTKQSGPHTGQYCNQCNSWIQWIPQPIENFIWPIGAKHKGKPILEIAKQDKQYLQWAADTLSDPKLKAKAQEALRHNLPDSDTLYTIPGQPEPRRPARMNDPNILPWDDD